VFQEEASSCVPALRGQDVLTKRDVNKKNVLSRETKRDHVNVKRDIEIKCVINPRAWKT